MIQYNIVLIQVFLKGCPSITTFLVQAVLKLQTRRTVKSSPRWLNNIGGWSIFRPNCSFELCARKVQWTSHPLFPMLISSTSSQEQEGYARQRSSCVVLDILSPCLLLVVRALHGERRARHVWLLHAIPKSLNLTQLSSGGGKRSRWSPTIATHLIFTKQF